MFDAFFIYHYHDRIYWLLSDLSIEHKKVIWNRFHPFIFTDPEEVDLAVDLIRHVMPDLDIRFAPLSRLIEIIEYNSSLEAFS